MVFLFSAWCSCAGRMASTIRWRWNTANCKDYTTRYSFQWLQNILPPLIAWISHGITNWKDPDPDQFVSCAQIQVAIFPQTCFSIRVSDLTMIENRVFALRWPRGYAHMFLVLLGHSDLARTFLSSFVEDYRRCAYSVTILFEHRRSATHRFYNTW